jgi:hypothetical protein
MCSFALSYGLMLLHGGGYKLAVYCISAFMRTKYFNVLTEFFLKRDRNNMIVAFERLSLKVVSIS